MLNKSEIMKNSWKAFKKGDFETFAEALKAMWQLFKKSIKLFADEIQSVEDLKGFNADGYAFAEQFSKGNTLVFIR